MNQYDSKTVTVASPWVFL